MTSKKKMEDDLKTKIENDLNKNGRRTNQPKKLRRPKFFFEKT